ncbi:MAG TPA: hypothetical protein DCM45_03950 [Clostridiales bacterium]|nr:hypothetical protein [Clostridiales bacterium]
MSDVSARDLNRYLFFLNRRRTQFMAERLNKYGLMGPMYSFLLCLEKNHGISQDFLVSYFSVDKGTVARLCKRLEELGLILRSICDDDRRLYQLALTEQGREMLKVIHQHLNDWSDRLLAGFDQADRQAAFVLLQRMADNIT